MIQVLSRALNILELLASEPGREFPLGDISSRLGLDKGTCANILRTLRDRGYVSQPYPRSGYKLGYKAYHITGRNIENDELTKVARSDMENLGRLINETVLLSVIRNDRRVTLYSTVPDREIIVRTKGEKAIYSACTGRVIMAYYTPDHLEKLIIRLGLPSAEEWPGVALSQDPAGKLANELARIRQDGYAIHRDTQGIVGFAAPLFKGGHIAGSIGLYLPVERLRDEKETLTLLLDCAGKVNVKLERTSAAEGSS